MASLEISSEKRLSAIIKIAGGDTETSVYRNGTLYVEGVSQEDLDAALVTYENETYLQKEGGEQKIRINPQSNSIGLDSYHEGLTLKWTGRMIEIADDITLSHYYVLDDADVTDLDENGIADDAEGN